MTVTWRSTKHCTKEYKSRQVFFVSSHIDIALIENESDSHTTQHLRIALMQENNIICIYKLFIVVINFKNVVTLLLVVWWINVSITCSSSGQLKYIWWVSRI